MGPWTWSAEATASTGDCNVEIGVVETLEGRLLVFSILVNYPRISGINNAAWKPMQDRICVALVEHGDVGGAEEKQR